jgi:hypothetical protein
MSSQRAEPAAACASFHTHQRYRAERQDSQRTADPYFATNIEGFPSGAND